MIAAFLTGLLGSLHCLSMCGPIAMAMPGRSGGRVLYQVGRIWTYALLGGLVSMVGVAASFWAMQQAVSVALGVGMLLVAVVVMVGKMRQAGPVRRLSGWVIRTGSRLLAEPTPGKLFALGMVNGLLPCGLVYLGLFQAAMAPGVGEGMGRMALFGLGTLPMLLGAAYLGPWMRRHWPGGFRWWLPAMMAGVGLLLILRGMSLGIPYVSPRMEFRDGEQAIPVCAGETPSAPVVYSEMPAK